MVDKSEIVLQPKEIKSSNFEDTVNSILCGLGAQKYIEIFKKQDIDQYGLSELSDEDLRKLGIVEPEIRNQLIERAKLLPAYEESQAIRIATLGPMEMVEVFEECALLLHRIHLSMVASNAALSKSKKVSDCLLYKDKYASNVALATLNEISNILNSMEIAVNSKFKIRKAKNNKKKKILVGTIGSAVIATLAVLFTRSLKQL
ncbi:unnamed protein product [Spodoptera littoralis]|uniref:SAM domain-containing protein n=1 Tax=Spodoptera littoralis TaxID=7109 RepID=A0A9P0IF92_SPOLI|nr:unnamed protein product [Spodoptera littoralis]CAH1646108.1 unnamed protein product [Spodoptera littoralis]